MTDCKGLASIFLQSFFYVLIRIAVKVIFVIRSIMLFGCIFDNHVDVSHRDFRDLGIEETLSLHLLVDERQRPHPHSASHHLLEVGQPQHIIFVRGGHIFVSGPIARYLGGMHLETFQSSKVIVKLHYRIEVHKDERVGDRKSDRIRNVVANRANQ